MNVARGERLAPLQQDSTWAMMRRVIARRDGLAVTIITLALYCGVVACVAPFSTHVESWLLKRHQLRSGFVGHVALLPYAAMYTFEQELCIGIPQSATREPVDDGDCDRLFYVDGTSAPLSCETLPHRMPTNHFPSAKLMEYAGYVDRCASDRMDFIVRSTGWNSTMVHRIQLFREGEDVRWSRQP